MDINAAITNGNIELEKVLRALAAGMQLPVTTGNIYFVVPTTNSNYVQFARKYGNLTYADSTKFLQTSLSNALTASVAARGDVILLAPGYTQTVSSATTLVISKSGVTIIGLGLGSLRATITLDTLTTATIKITADNVTMRNIVVSANFADIVSAFTLTTAKNFTLDKWEVVETAVNMNFLHVIDLDATSNHADGLTVTNGLWNEPDAATLAFALIDGDVDRLNISDNVMYTGNATQDTPFLLSCGSKVLTGARILRNYCQMVGNASSTAALFIVNSSTTSNGVVALNFLKHLTTTGDIICNTGTKLAFHDNKMTGVIDKSGYTLPAADS
jgi:hypothetical protein